MMKRKTLKNRKTLEVHDEKIDNISNAFTAYLKSILLLEVCHK